MNEKCTITSLPLFHGRNSSAQDNNFNTAQCRTTEANQPKEKSLTDNLKEKKKETIQLAADLYQGRKKTKLEGQLQETQEQLQKIQKKIERGFSSSNRLRHAQKLERMLSNKVDQLNYNLKKLNILSAPFKVLDRINRGVAFKNQYEKSVMLTPTMKATDAAIAGAIKFVYDRNPIIAVATGVIDIATDEQATKTINGFSSATLSVAHAAVTGDDRPMANFVEKSLAGQYGPVIKGATLVGKCIEDEWSSL